jgi:hypothetical protein
MIIQEIAPQSGIEWLWAADLIELSWDIVRYRALRQKMLEIRRRDAIDAMLQRLDSPIADGCSAMQPRCCISPFKQLRFKA